MKDRKTAENYNEVARQPLFTGEGVRDASVSEIEKLAEASFVIRKMIMGIIGKKKEK